jgi:hypothetical protein
MNANRGLSIGSQMPSGERVTGKPIGGLANPGLLGGEVLVHKLNLNGIGHKPDPRVAAHSMAGWPGSATPQ